MEYPKTHETRSEQLAQYSQLDESSKRILEGEIMTQYGVRLTADNAELIKKYEDGDRSNETVQAMKQAVDMLDVHVEENLIWLEFRGQWLKISQNVLNRVNDIIKNIEIQKREQEYKEEILKTIQNADFSLMDEKERNYIYNMIMSYDTLSGYHKLGVEVHLAQYLNNRIIDLSDVEYRSGIIGKLKK